MKLCFNVDCLVIYKGSTEKVSNLVWEAIDDFCVLNESSGDKSNITLVGLRPNEPNVQDRVNVENTERHRTDVRMGRFQIVFVRNESCTLQSINQMCKHFKLYSIEVMVTKCFLNKFATKLNDYEHINRSKQQNTRTKCKHHDQLEIAD